MDIGTAIAVQFYYLGMFFVPFLLFQMFVGGGLRNSRHSLGFVAEDCPQCKTARCFSIARVGIANSILFTPMSQGVLRGYAGVCKHCAGKYELQATDYAAIEADEKTPLDVLIAKTSPRLGANGMAAEAAFERFGRIREPLIRASRAMSVQYDGGYGANFSEGLSFLIAFELAFWLGFAFPEQITLFPMSLLFAVAFVPLLWLSQKLMDRYGGGYRIGFAALFLVVGSLALSIIAFFSFLSYTISAGLLIAGLAVTCLVVAAEPRRRFDGEVNVELAASLKPLNPTLAELDECLGALRRNGERCRFVEAQSLLEDISKAVARPVEPQAAKAEVSEPAAEIVPPPIVPGQMGECPNCGGRIAMDSVECPIPKCHAVFGPGSEWKIAPVRSMPS